MSRVSDIEQVPLVYKRNRQDGVSGTPFGQQPVRSRPTPEGCKRNRQVGVSGSPFRTITIVKYLNSLRLPEGC
ncbi:MAG: hypothetical protein LBK25_06170 [Treponema sp.]|nr:hypothetical protein [Treponema sp.]